MATGYTVTTGAAAIALAAATTKTIMNLIAGATNPATIVEMSFGFDGVTASAVPVYVELCQSTQAGAGSGQTAQTPALIRGQIGAAAQSTFNFNYATTEPTVLTPVKHWLLTPNGGLLVIQFPLGREIATNLSGSAAVKALAVRMTAPAIVNVRGYLEFEE